MVCNSYVDEDTGACIHILIHVPKGECFSGLLLSCLIPGGVQARLDGALGSQIKWVANLPTTGGMKLDDLYGPFQARPF